jgi:DNA-binding transcriptional MerR regulator
MIKIGHVAREADVSVDAIRFYERRGVLPEPERLPSGYRVYNQETIERLRLTKSLQALGMTLDEVIDTIKVVDTGDVNCIDEQWRLQVVLDRVDGELKRLKQLRHDVVDALGQCEQGACMIQMPEPPSGPLP